MGTLEQLGTALRTLHETVVTSVAFVKAVKEEVDKIVTEETRQRHLIEVGAFFPDYLLHLQCRKCIADKMCWRGHAQGFLCGAYWMGNHQHPDAQERMERLKSCFASTEALETRITDADFLDLIGLCYLVEANLRILPVVNNANMRCLLHTLVEKMCSPSIYALTFCENELLSQCNINLPISEGENNGTRDYYSQEASAGAACADTSAGNPSEGTSTESGRNST